MIKSIINTVLVSGRFAYRIEVVDKANYNQPLSDMVGHLVVSEK